MPIFGKTKSGQFYNKASNAKDNSDNPVTFADAYVDEKEDLKDKHDFADERIAEQEEKERLEQIKKEQEKADVARSDEEERLKTLREIDEVIKQGMDVDEKIKILESYTKNGKKLNSNDQKELHQEIKELKQLSKKIDKRNESSNDETKSDADSKKSNIPKSNIQSPRIIQERQKDHSKDNLPGPDESIRMSYLLATARDE